jgi:hypothetical protein
MQALSLRRALNEAESIAHDILARCDVSTFGQAQRFIRAGSGLRLKTYPGMTGSVLGFEVRLQNRSAQGFWYLLFQPVPVNKGLEEWR